MEFFFFWTLDSEVLPPKIPFPKLLGTGTGSKRNVTFGWALGRWSKAPRFMLAKAGSFCGYRENILVGDSVMFFFSTLVWESCFVPTFLTGKHPKTSTEPEHHPFEEGTHLQHHFWGPC